MDHDVAFRTWNVFRRRRDAVMCCAVSADVPVPRFLLSGEWVFGFAVSDGDPPVAGFSAPDAAAGPGLDGVHLFLAVAASRGAGPGRPSTGVAGRPAQDGGEADRPQGAGIRPADEAVWIHGCAAPLGLSSGRPLPSGASAIRSIDP